MQFKEIKKLYQQIQGADNFAIVFNMIDCLVDNFMEKYPDLYVKNKESDNIIQSLYFDVLNIKYNLASWVRTLLKYGTFYLKLHFNENKIIETIQSIHPRQVEVIQGTHSDAYIYNQRRHLRHEIIQFRIPCNSEYLPYGTPILTMPGRNSPTPGVMFLIKEILELQLYRIGLIQLYSLGIQPEDFEVFFFKKTQIKYLNGKYKTITLCGSTKFKEQFLAAQQLLTLEGHVVISVGLFGHSGDEQVWSENTKTMLDEIHIQKIAMADQIFVINKNGYVGESTKKQIQYAISKNKIIKYLEPVNEDAE